MTLTNSITGRMSVAIWMHTGGTNNKSRLWSYWQCC